ncbi:MAG: Uncharacterized protein G01um101416_286 [Microgenomates group bacterium Gr01-1014_16]|nr:MAG: Uncharacterized protein G01um101416_286 [Microgenomates group bacterium Gr01-1014_16]
MKLLAQGVPLGNINGIGPLGTVATQTDAFVAFTTVLSTTVGVLTVSAGIWFIFQIFGGSLQWLTSGGDKQGLEAAKKRITHAIVGLLMVVLSYALISIIGLIFGLNILSPIGSLLGINLPGGGGGGGTCPIIGVPC